MITITEPYHLDYLKSLRPIERGHTSDLLLEDDYYRVHLSLLTPADGVVYDHEVIIEAKMRGIPDWTTLKTYPAAQGTLFCEPENDGQGVQPSTIASCVGKIFNDLDSVAHRASSPMSADCRDFRNRLHDKLLAEGWRIKVNPNSAGWKVLPPMKRMRNDG